MRLISILAFMLALTGAALAAPLPGPGISADEVAAVLRARGHTLEITKDNDGDPLIKVAEPAKYLVYFYDRNDKSRFDAIQFAVSFDDVTPARIADWNRGHRFGRAYLEQDGKSWVEMDMETTLGISTEALEENLARWLAVMKDFSKHIAEK